MRVWLAGLGLVGLVGCGVDLGERSVGAQAEHCADCHPRQATEFAGSAMASSSRSALYEALAEEALDVLGDRALCDGCHVPEVGGEHGVGCVSCHGAVGNRAASNGELVHDLEGPVLGPTGVADARAGHETAEGGFLMDSELCGTCHEVKGPAGFEERPFAHWRASPAAADGVGCVDCHMGSVAGEDRALSGEVVGPAAVVPGDRLPDRVLSNHRFVGLNGDPEQAVALLRRAVGLELAVVDGVATVTVANRNSGHPLPDGASFLRDLRVVVWEGGPVAGLEVASWPLAAGLLRDGVEVASPVLADEVVDNAIEPLGSRSWTVETGGQARACVLFQAVRADLAAHLGVAADTGWREVVCVRMNER